jgi:hypothetical protein
MADPYRFLSGVGQQHLLKCISILFNHDEELLKFFFSHKQPILRMPAKCLMDEASKFDIKEQLLIRVALDCRISNMGTRRFPERGPARTTAGQLICG